MRTTCPHCGGDLTALIKEVADRAADKAAQIIMRFRAAQEAKK